MIDWDDLRYYLAAAQAGTVTAAADILKVSRTTVSRRVEALERALRLPLFELTSSGPGSTDVGREVLACARDVETRISEMLDKLTRADLQSTTIRISTPAELELNLIAWHAALTASVPGITLEFVQSFRPEDDLRQRNALVGLCVADTLPVNLKGTCVATILQRPYRCTATKRSGNDLQWIGWGRDMQHCTSAVWMQTNLERNEILMRVNSAREMKEAIRAGLGIGYVSEAGAAEENLVPLDDLGPPLTSKLWLLMHEDVPPALHVRAVLENLQTVFQK